MCGSALTHGGVAYSLVTRGAADASEDADRRMGLAWARSGDRLFLATSERALLLALDEHLAGRGFSPPLPGLASLELDLDALRQDGIRQWDFKVKRVFRIHEQFRTSFDVDMLNLTNHTNFTGPQTDPTRGDFGQVTTQRGLSRVIQFNLRVDF